MAKLNKDLLPLYIALVSGLFSILSTIADNLTKNVKIEVLTKSVQLKAPTISKVIYNKNNEIIAFILANPKPIAFGLISLLAIIIYVVIRLKKRPSRKSK